MSRGKSITALLFAAALPACAQLPPPAPPATAAIRPPERQQAARFVDIVGPSKQHDPPFLGIAYTNFYCLRSFLDRQTGAVANQLYVADSYFGAERHWNGAQDGAGHRLPFVLVSSNKITCEKGCAYADEFAATLPETELRSRDGDLLVVFTARSGDGLTIALSGGEIAHQLTAVAAARKGLLPQTAATPAD
jgi:hypothetical protein